MVGEAAGTTAARGTLPRGLHLAAALHPLSLYHPRRLWTLWHFGHSARPWSDPHWDQDYEKSEHGQTAPATRLLKLSKYISRLNPLMCNGKLLSLIAPNLKKVFGNKLAYGIFPTAL
jgi:hypothetical protein